MNDGSEVDLNGSLWYKLIPATQHILRVLKLTSTGHYGIALYGIGGKEQVF